jgi:RNA-directed DNA polymerase
LFSSLLSNIKLDEFGKELERRYHRFDRYADDICIYPKSERADQRVLESASTKRLHTFGAPSEIRGEPPQEV